MTPFNISGTYMTSWLQPDGKTYIPGPVVIDASNQSISVNGAAIASPSFTNTGVSWSTTNGNATSAKLTFYQNGGVNGFVGVFAQGSDPLPVANNLFGNAGAASQQLST